MTGFKTLWSATKIIAGIESMHMHKKGQLGCPGGLAFSPVDYFDSLAAASIARQHRPPTAGNPDCYRTIESARAKRPHT